MPGEHKRRQNNRCDVSSITYHKYTTNKGTEEIENVQDSNGETDDQRSHETDEMSEEKEKIKKVAHTFMLKWVVND